jgi:hypothetical protein
VGSVMCKGEPLPVDLRIRTGETLDSFSLCFGGGGGGRRGRKGGGNGRGERRGMVGGKGGEW